MDTIGTKIERHFQIFILAFLLVVFHIGCNLTLRGKIYATPQIGKIWHEYTAHQGIKDLSHNDFERINFFPDNTMMLSGSLDEDGKTTFIYRSTDYGKSWAKIVFGNTKRINAVYVGQRGKAWMTGDSQLIY